MLEGPGTITDQEEATKQYLGLTGELGAILEELEDSDDPDDIAAVQEIGEFLEENETTYSEATMQKAIELLNKNAPVFCTFGETIDGVGFIIDDKEVNEAFNSGEMVEVADSEEVMAAKEKNPEAEFFAVLDPQGNVTELFDVKGETVWEV